MRPGVSKPVDLIITLTLTLNLTYDPNQISEHGLYELSEYRILGNGNIDVLAKGTRLMID